MTVTDNAAWVVSALDAASEQWVVCQHGADANHDAGQACACLVYVMAGGFTRYPATVTGVRGNFAVQRHGVFEYNIRGFACDKVEEYIVELAALVFADAGFDRNACIPQNLCALAGNKRICVQTADEYTSNVLFENGLCAGRGAAPVAAWLKRDV